MSEGGGELIKNTTQCPRPVFEPGTLDTESSALISGHHAPTVSLHREERKLKLRKSEIFSTSKMAVVDFFNQ